MKQVFILILVSWIGVAKGSEDDGNVMKHQSGALRPVPVKDKFVSDAMREAMGGDPQVSVALTREPSDMDKIQGKCETKTKDAISVTVPCRDVELILKNGSKIVEKTDLDPRGGFLFEKLSPNYSYTLLVRKKSSTHISQMDGMKTGMIYTFSIDESH